MKMYILLVVRAFKKKIIFSESYFEKYYIWSFFPLSLNINTSGMLLNIYGSNGFNVKA